MRSTLARYTVSLIHTPYHVSLFGYFVAWQWEATRLFYSDTAEIKPFFTHFADLFLREDPFIILFQLLRGALWTGLALLIVRMIIAKRWEASLAVALNFSLLLAVPLIMFPNPYMPPMVAQSHFVELMTSMVLFGGVAGWVLWNGGKEGATREESDWSLDNP